MSGPVAFVSDTREFGGAERYAAVLVEALRGECEFVAILGDDAAAETRDRLERAGARVVLVRGAARRRPGPAGVRHLRNAIHAASPALVHVSLSDQGDGLGALLAARLAGRPTVATLHIVVPGRALWRETFSRAALRVPRRVIAVSEAVAEYLRLRGISATVVANGLPETAPDPEAARLLGVGPADFVVGGVGRLHRQKGWDVLCRAADLVRAEVPRAAFVVIGDGAERERLAGSSECGSVRFLGYRESAGSLVSGFDVLVIPSRYEGFGLVAVEAMQAGVPVVATRAGGLAEVVGDCGELVPPEDAQALARAIVRLAREPDRRRELAERGRERARERFGVERMARETLAVYRAAAP